jgi:hypothetical protein
VLPRRFDRGQRNIQHAQQASEGGPCFDSPQEGGLCPSTSGGDAPGSAAAEDCAICMDSRPEVAVRPCGHALCFSCACKLCSLTLEPGCPFCRGTIAAFGLLGDARMPRSAEEALLQAKEAGPAVEAGPKGTKPGSLGAIALLGA